MPTIGVAVVNLPPQPIRLLCGFILCAHPLLAQDHPVPPSVSQFKKLSVQELMDIEVTSVSKKEEQLGGAAAAVVVLTGEDIRRSGATTIPDALRLLPGIHVAQQTSNLWA